MTIEEIIESVERVCRQHRVEHLSLFGSYAKGTETSFSDVDFIVYGVDDLEVLKEKIDNIPTVKKIDIFDYDHISNKYLKDDMDKYGKKIY